MSTKAFYHLRDHEVDLADLTVETYNELVSLHGKIRRDEPVITCLKNNEPMYVYRHPSGRYYLRHFAGAGDHGPHSISTMSVEHRRQAEYTERAADNAGIKSRLEVPTGTTPSGRQSTRLDVGVWGAQNIGFEIQRSQLSLANAMDRASRSYENGWPTVWVTDQERDPAWADRVPTARLITRGGWDQQTLDPNTARVAISRFTREKDSSKPSGWRYQREPVAVLLDELAFMVPAGDIVPVVVGTKGTVVLAFKDAIEVIDSCTYPGASKWDPVAKMVAKKERPQTYSLECGAHKDTDVAAALVQEIMAAPVVVTEELRKLPTSWWPPAPTPVVSPPRITAAPRDIVEPVRAQDDEPEALPGTPLWMQPGPDGNCTVCGHRLWAPQSREIGRCAAHHRVTA